MNKKNLSAKLNQAIAALQGAVAEINREECACQHKSVTRQPTTRAQRLCECEREFGPWGTPIPVPMPLPSTPAWGHTNCTCTQSPLPQWGVTGEPKEDDNKVFGINVRVDEPRIEDYATRWQFERDHAKFDRLVDAAEACDWENKSNTAPLHKVNAIRRRIEDGPVMNLNLVGETHWF